MKKKASPQPHFVVPDFPRADVKALLNFDPRTKRCTMNCGQHLMDPRSRTECMFLCDDCETLVPDDKTGNDNIPAGAPNPWFHT